MQPGIIAVPRFKRNPQLVLTARPLQVGKTVQDGCSSPVPFSTRVSPISCTSWARSLSTDAPDVNPAGRGLSPCPDSWRSSGRICRLVYAAVSISAVAKTCQESPSSNHQWTLGGLHLLLPCTRTGMPHAPPPPGRLPSPVSPAEFSCSFACLAIKASGHGVYLHLQVPVLFLAKSLLLPFGHQLHRTKVGAAEWDGANMRIVLNATSHVQLTITGELDPCLIKEKLCGADQARYPPRAGSIRDPLFPAGPDTRFVPCDA